MELASTTLQSIETKNLNNIYSLANKLKFDVSNNSEKYLLYMQYVPWACNNSSIALLTEYSNNPIFQELPDKQTYSASSDKRMYLDMRTSKENTEKLEKIERDDSDLTLKTNLKALLTKKMRLRVWGY